MIDFEAVWDLMGTLGWEHRDGNMPEPFEAMFEHLGLTVADWN